MTSLWVLAPQKRVGLTVTLGKGSAGSQQTLGSLRHWEGNGGCSFFFLIPLCPGGDIPHDS
jgi:hypothetical protein